MQTNKISSATYVKKWTKINDTMHQMHDADVWQMRNANILTALVNAMKIELRHNVLNWTSLTC